MRLKYYTLCHEAEDIESYIHLTAPLLAPVGRLSAMEQLFIASYAGTISTLQLVPELKTYKLEERAITKTCSPTPSWITLDAQRRILYATEGGKSGKGTLIAYRIQQDGSLVESSSVPVPVGAAYHVLYDDNNAIGIPFL